MKALRKAMTHLMFACSLCATSATFAKHLTESPQAVPASWSNIKHVVYIILENETQTNALKQAFLKSLYSTGAGLGNNSAITHPSQPNYIALVSGQKTGVSGDGNVSLSYRNIADLLEAKKLTWKVYAENWPGHCFPGASNSGGYFRKHNPFISFTAIQNNPARCTNIVAGTQFFSDLSGNLLPTYSFYVPNIKNDGHDTGVAFAAKWLQATFGPVFNNKTLMANTLFIVTFDEGKGSNNVVYTAFIGAAVKPGVVSKVKYTHYSLLKTTEAIFNLGSLNTNDSKAALITDIWQP